MASVPQLQIWQRNLAAQARAEDPYFSVILLGHRRVKGLLQALHTLAEKTEEKNWEILVVANGGRSDIAAAIADFAQKTTQPLSWISVAELRPGAARNIAIAKASGEILLFLDDDIESFQDLFATARAEFSRPEICAAGGPNLTPPESSLWERASGLAYANFFITGPTRRRYALSSRKFPASEHDLILCNLFIRRSAMRENYFPPLFVSNEENYLLQQLHGAGKLMVAHPGLAVYHARRSDFWGLWEQGQKYGTGRAQNILANTQSFSWKYFLPLLLWSVLLLSFFISPLAALSLSIVYSLLLVSYSFFLSERKESFGAYCILPLVGALIHLAYSVGMLKGLVHWGWRKNGLQEIY